MRKPSEVTSIAEAKEYIKDLSILHTDAGDQLLFHMSQMILSLSDTLNLPMSIEQHRSYTVSVAKAIESLAREGGGSAGPLVPGVFFLIKYDFGRTDDSESSQAVRYILVNSLIHIIGLPDAAINVKLIRSFAGFAEFYEYVESFKNGRSNMSVLEGYQALVTSYEHSLQELKTTFTEKYVPILKSLLATRPHESYEEKADLVRWLNSELRRLDLSIRSPATGRTANLTADSSKKNGRFRIKSEDEDGQQSGISFTKLPDLLDKLELMEAPPRREPLKEWRDKVSRPTGGPTLG